MAIVCTSCDREPLAGARAGAPCPACGDLLVRVETTDELVGTTIDGRFEVLAPLGQGGMGKVYRARQLSIGREVALKVLDRRIERDVGAVKRFFREAKVASTLQHPNTVPIIDFGQNTDGRLFLVMELVHGRTLQEEIDTVGPLPLHRICTIGVQLCEALEAAHEIAIVHRDLKLENVMLLAAKRDHVKILDFGLARSLADPSTAMTATGLISGTPRYMPPEVAIEAAAPEPSQDIYALGVILAELALGRPLWSAPTIEALMTKKLELDATLREVPDPLRFLARWLLDNEPAQRPTASVARQRLRELDVRSPLALELDPAAATDPDVPPFLVATHDAGRAAPAGDATLAGLERALANPSLVAIDALSPGVPRTPAEPKPATDLALPPRLPAVAQPIALAPTQSMTPVGGVPVAGSEPLGALAERFAAPREEPIRLEIDRDDLQRDRRIRSTRRDLNPPSHRPLPAQASGRLSWFLIAVVVAALGLGGYVVYDQFIRRGSPVTRNR